MDLLAIFLISGFVGITFAMNRFYREEGQMKYDIGVLSATDAVLKYFMKHPEEVAHINLDELIKGMYARLGDEKK
jgi:hypothetical protein